MPTCTVERKRLVQVERAAGPAPSFARQLFQAHAFGGHDCELGHG